MRQKGFAPIVVVLFISILAIFGYVLYNKYFSELLSNNKVVSTATIIPTSSPSSLNNTPEGTKMVTTDGRTTFFFPAGSFSGKETLETSPANGCYSPKPLYYGGAVASVKLIEGPNVEPLKDFSISMKYDENDIPHINLQTLSIYYCPVSEENPTYKDKMVSQVDELHKVITTTSKKFGTFGILGQLKCSNDSREPFDDSYKINGGQDISFNTEVKDLFDTNRDVDWYFIYLKKDKKYTIKTVNVASGVIPIIELSTDGVEIVQTNKGNLNETISVDNSLYNDFIQIKVTSGSNSQVGCDAKYSLLVSEI